MITIKRKPDFKKLMYEKEAWSKNEFVCGVDEVGVGSFAGPVVAAAVILKSKTPYKYLKDSKLLTFEEREKAYKWIIKNSDYAVGIVHHRIIDSINIYQAKLCAMKRAVTQILLASSIKPSLILVDFVSFKLDVDDLTLIHFAKGETKSSSIAAASIVAKVTRDRLMIRLDGIIPGYSFNTHKGYGTPIHKRFLNQKGATFCHRFSFSIINTIINNFELAL